jgi:hypothetical protein
MSKWRILHIPSGRFVTKTEKLAIGKFGLQFENEYSIGKYTTGKVYEAWFKWRAETMLENIFAGSVRPDTELLWFSDNNKCEFEVVKA